jgi:hypothetical protein
VSLGLKKPPPRCAISPAPPRRPQSLQVLPDTVELMGVHRLLSIVFERTEVTVSSVRAVADHAGKPLWVTSTAGVLVHGVWLT